MASNTVCKLVLPSLTSCQSAAHIKKHKPTADHLGAPKTKAIAHLNRVKRQEAMLEVMKLNNNAHLLARQTFTIILSLITDEIVILSK